MVMKIKQCCCYRHGILQPRNPWSDGPEYVTQCPIQPGTNFTYELVLSTEEGTVWWHAHSDWTRASVHGVIIILPAVGTTFPFPEPDEDEVIVIASWYKGNLQSRVDMAMAEKNTLPDSDAFTINGQPGDLIPCSADSTYRWKVEYGKTYLLRILNANMDEDLFFGIAEHNLTMVGMDGCYTKPLDTSYIMISAGQTMDVLLTANQSLGHYYMAARHFATENMDRIVWFDHYNVTAIMEYNGNYTYPTYPSLPSTLPMYFDMQSYKDFIFQIRSLATPEHPVSVPQDRDITTRMFITTSMNSLYCSADSDSSCQNIQITSSVNNLSWFNPSDIDILQAYYRNISGTYTTDFPDYPPTFYNFTEESMDIDTVLTVQGRKVKVLEYNESVEIVFQGTDVLAGSINHPMHLHGYTFYVVGQGFGNFDNVTDPKNFNLVDPPEVVTFGVPKKGWMAIRFTANNPVKNGPTTETSMRPPPAYMPLCPSNSGIQNFHDSAEKKMEYT
ncbi:hypothetical protein M0R45_027442 [Rubus argutus]|uniref:laccase n=1 Tax=Rubus argutus TaxID=59490 RepID=A0AAW1X323_RUBAR